MTVNLDKPPIPSHLSVEKRCPRCKKVKVRAKDFEWRRKKLKGEDYWFTEATCKVCQYEQHKVYRVGWLEKNKEKVRQQKLDWQKANPEKVRQYKLMANHGIDDAIYGHMLELQNGVCAICGKKDTTKGKKGYLSVDHDAATGEIRGLLCHQCNIGIGNLRHDRDILLKAIEYLKEAE